MVLWIVKKLTNQPGNDEESSTLEAIHDPRIGCCNSIHVGESAWELCIGIPVEGVWGDGATVLKGDFLFKMCLPVRIYCISGGDIIEGFKKWTIVVIIFGIYKMELS